MRECKKYMDISIAVVIPVYNVERYLCQCLDSVVAQSIPFDEVILVNDGSTDYSLTICREYVSKYKYFKLIDQENQGLSVARNVGIKSASSEYIMFLDSDDYLRLDTVKIMKKQFLKFSYDAVYFDANIIYENGVNYSVKKNFYDRSKAKLDEIQWSGWKYFTKCYPKNYVVSSCMAVYKRSIIISKDIKFPEGLFFEDNYFTLAFIGQARCVIHISEKLYQRRYREHSIMTSRYSERKFADYIQCFLLIAEEISRIKSNNIIKLEEKFLEFISDWCNNAFKNYYMCVEQDIILSKNTIFLFHCMLEKYLWLVDKLDFNVFHLDLVVLNKILKSFHYMDIYEFGNKSHIQEMISKIIELEKMMYLNILNELPLNKRCKIGIYGTGKHTEGLLNIFKKLIGEITCDLIFLDSQRDNEEYKGSKIINYQKIIDEKLDLIIISSFLYESEMFSNIKSVNVNIPIYTFYNILEDDVFSEYKIFLAYC